MAWLDSGLGAVLGAETGFGLAAGFTVATGTALRQAWRGRADDDPGSYADGVPVELIATRAHPDATIAKLTAEGDTLAELHLETLHPEDGPADGIDTVTARVAGKLLRLQHRHPAATGTTDGPAPGNVDLEVRWVDDDEQPAAVAARISGPEGDRWSVTGRNVTVTWTLPRGTGRRPTRRVLTDTTREERVFLLVHRRQRTGPRARFTSPPELETAELLLCVWLCHLLDAHAAGHETWPRPGPQWTVVPDDFPPYRVGPAGLGSTQMLPTGHVNVSPGGW